MNLSVQCSLERLRADTDLSHFSCDHTDLDDFLCNEAKQYAKELLGVTYLFRNDSDRQIVGFFTVSNAALNLEPLTRGRKKKVDGKIPHVKRRKTYPAILIGRLGVSVNFKGQSVGGQILDFVKGWFRYDNKTGCRFVVVDAYNDKNVLKFYQKNEFSFFQTEEDELTQLWESRGKGERLTTRPMYFDLARMKDLN